MTVTGYTSPSLTMGLLSWNCGGNVIERNALALIHEQERLRRKGIPSLVLLLDNGSTDGSQEILKSLANPPEVFCLTIKPGCPRSSSICRNLLTLYARQNTDYVALIDGDIEVVPGSMSELVSSLHVTTNLGSDRVDVLSPDPSNQSPPISRVPLRLQFSKAAQMYVCGYGVFRTSIFDGVQFDESGPFGELGWGFEDDDFFLQLLSHNISTYYVDNLPYRHEKRSSWGPLRSLGVDIEERFNRRRDYLLAKWRECRDDGVIERIQGPLRLIQGQHVRFD